MACDSLCYVTMCQLMAVIKVRKTFYHEFCKLLKIVLIRGFLGHDFNATINGDVKDLYSCMGLILESHVHTTTTTTNSFWSSLMNTIRDWITPFDHRRIGWWVLGTRQWVLRNNWITSLPANFTTDVRKCRVRRASSKLFETEHYFIEMVMYIQSVRQLPKKTRHSLQRPKPCLDVLQNRTSRIECEKKLNEVLADEPPEEIEQLNDLPRLRGSDTKEEKTCSSTSSTMPRSTPLTLLKNSKRLRVNLP